jgi:hypothetical protein
MPLEIRQNLRSKIVVVLLLIASAFFVASCGDKEFRLTREQVEERIKKELPNGATQGQVKQFISSFKPEFEVDEREYEVKASAAAAEASGSVDSHYHGIIRARIRKIGRDPKIFALFDLHLEFYFDEKGLLVGHKLETYGYH